jgi:putative ribosome biogenesis GTPase RsgA
LICEEGVVYRDVVITDPDTPIRVRARTLVKGGGYELMVGDRVFKFRDDPSLLGRRLKGWAEFLFHEFLPRARVLTRRRSPHADRLLLQKSATCPECARTFLGLAGEIGLPAVPPANG